jgi:hypothetical protein
MQTGRRIRWLTSDRGGKPAARGGRLGGPEFTASEYSGGNISLVYAFSMAKGDAKTVSDKMSANHLN